MRPRSNSSNKAGKRIIEAKTVRNYSSPEMGCDLCLLRLSYKSTEKLFKKAETKKPKFVFENNFFKSHNKLMITTKSDG